MMLAEAQPPAPALSDLLAKLARLEMPARVDLLNCMDSLSALQAAALVAVGLVYLLYGCRIFKTLVVINSAAAGGLIGAGLGSMSGSGNMPLVMGLAGAVLLGALSWPLLRVAVGVMGALAGGLVGYALWSVIAVALDNSALLQHAWAGGVLGMVTLGMLTFIVFPTTVMVFTALQGALMGATGVCGLLLGHGGMQQSLHQELLGNDYLLPVIVGVPAIVGFAIQHSTGKKKPKGPEK